MILNTVLYQDTKNTITTVTLPYTGWSSNTLTVTVSGVTSDSTVIVAPKVWDSTTGTYYLTYVEAWRDCNILCVAQGTNSLIFYAETTPSLDVLVEVVILGE